VLTAGLIRANLQPHLALARVGEQPPSSTPTSLPVRTEAVAQTWRVVPGAATAVASCGGLATRGWVASVVAGPWCGRVSPPRACLGPFGGYLVAVNLGEVLGHHHQSPLGAHFDPASSVKADDTLVVFGVTERRFGGLFAFLVPLPSVV